MRYRTPTTPIPVVSSPLGDVVPPSAGPSVERRRAAAAVAGAEGSRAESRALAVFVLLGVVVACAALLQWRMQVDGDGRALPPIWVMRTWHYFGPGLLSGALVAGFSAPRSRWARWLTVLTIAWGTLPDALARWHLPEPGPVLWRVVYPVAVAGVVGAWWWFRRQQRDPRL